MRFIDADQSRHDHRDGTSCACTCDTTVNLTCVEHVDPVVRSQNLRRRQVAADAVAALPAEVRRLECELTDTRAGWAKADEDALTLIRWYFDQEQGAADPRVDAAAVRMRERLDCFGGRCACGGCVL